MAYFARHDGGASAIEFALILPFLLLLVEGLGEYGAYLSAQRDVATVAASMADLTAELKTATPTALDDEFNITTSVMEPFPVAGLSVRLTNVVPSAMSGNTATAAQVGWCRAYGTGLPCAPNGTVISHYQNGAAVPLNMITSSGAGIITAEVLYNYTSPIQLLLPNTLSIYKVNFLNPRLTSQVTCAAC